MEMIESKFTAHVFFRDSFYTIRGLLVNFLEKFLFQSMDLLYYSRSLFCPFKFERNSVKSAFCNPPVHILNDVFQSLVLSVR
jgi:hypothetical protein